MGKGGANQRENGNTVKQNCMKTLSGKLMVGKMLFDPSLPPLAGSVQEGGCFSGPCCLS